MIKLQFNQILWFGCDTIRWIWEFAIQFDSIKNDFLRYFIKQFFFGTFVSAFSFGFWKMNKHKSKKLDLKHYILSCEKVQSNFYKKMPLSIFIYKLINFWILVWITHKWWNTKQYIRLYINFVIHWLRKMDVFQNDINSKDLLILIAWLDFLNKTN